VHLIINLLVPCLIFDKIVGNERLLLAENVVIPPLVGAATLLLGFAVAGLLAWKLPRITQTATRPEKGTYAYGVGLYNYGFIALPIAMLLFDSDTVGVLFVFNLGIELTIWTVGVLLFGPAREGLHRRILNPPLIAIVVSLLINFSGVAPRTPIFVTHSLGTMVQWLGACAIPMSLILIGAIMADFLPGTRWHRAAGLMGSATLLRNVLIPALFIAFAWMARPWLSDDLVIVLVIQAAMPAATISIVMAKAYGGDPSTAMKITLSSSVLGFITLPLWLVAGIRLFELIPAM